MRGEKGWAHSTAPQSHFPVEVFPDDRHWGETRQRRTDQHSPKDREDRVRGKGGERPGACAVLEHVNLTPAQVSSQLAGRASRLSCFHLLCSGSEGPAPKSFPAGPPEIKLSDSVIHSTAMRRRLKWQACDRQEQPLSGCTRCCSDFLWEELMGIACPDWVWGHHLLQHCCCWLDVCSMCVAPATKALSQPELLGIVLWVCAYSGINWM